MGQHFLYLTRYGQGKNRFMKLAKSLQSSEYKGIKLLSYSSCVREGVLVCAFWLVLCPRLSTFLWSSLNSSILQLFNPNLPLVLSPLISSASARCNPVISWPRDSILSRKVCLTSSILLCSRASLSPDADGGSGEGVGDLGAPDMAPDP